MERTKPPRVSIRDVAQAAGVSKAAAGFALQNRPEVSEATRKRVLRIAKRLGYSPDARLASWMARVQEAKNKEPLAIAWLNTHTEKDAWHRYKFLSPYLLGAKERASQLGYRLEEIWLSEPGMTMGRISRMLYQRGIEGAIVTHYLKHFHFKWDSMAGVSLEGTLFAPQIHSVQSDTFFNFLLAIKMLKRFGYRRIGICLAKSINGRTHDAIRAMASSLGTLSPKLQQVPPLFYAGEDPEIWQVEKKQIAAWLRRHRPEVIIGYSGRLVSFIEESGYRVPEDIGVVHLAVDDDVADWAGVHSNRRAVGRDAVQLVVSLMQTRQFGVPDAPMHALIRGSWQAGRTLLTPSPVCR